MNFKIVSYNILETLNILEDKINSKYVSYINIYCNI